MDPQHTIYRLIEALQVYVRLIILNRVIRHVVANEC